MWYGRNKILTEKRLEAGGGKLLKPVNILNLITLLLLSEIYHPNRNLHLLGFLTYYPNENLNS